MVLAQGKWRQVSATYSCKSFIGVTFSFPSSKLWHKKETENCWTLTISLRLNVSLLQISLERHICRRKFSNPSFFKSSLLIYNFLIRHHFFIGHGYYYHVIVDEYFCLSAVPGEGVGHRVTQDDEKNKGRVGSQQHHESGKADPTSRLHMTL